jgi:hypothetical protein
MVKVLSKLNLTFLGFLAVFIASRILVLLNRPEFSVVSHYYEPYTHMWGSGIFPYLKQIYEYGPHTIPLFYIPFMIQQRLGWSYYYLYKSILLIFDALIFIILMIALSQRKNGRKKMIASLVFYILGGWVLKEFYYDSYDLVFSGVWFLAIYFWLYGRFKLSRWWGDFLFWVATGLKYINFPLYPVYFFLREKKTTVTKLLVTLLVFLSVWIVPLAIFKKSLLTTFFLHSNRGLQVESLPANVVRLIDNFTQTEGFTTKSNAIEITGPITEQVVKIYNYIFPLALGGVLVFIYTITFLLKDKKTAKRLYLPISLLYIFSFMALGKILSTPYLIWPIPFLALYPFRSKKTQIVMYVWYLFVVYSSANPVKNIPVLFSNLHTIIGLGRGLTLAGMAIYFSFELKKAYKSLCSKK